jgi:hypothetical protein
MTQTSDIHISAEATLAVGADKERNGFFDRLRRRWATPSKGDKNDLGNETETTLSEADNDSFQLSISSSSDYDPSDAPGATYEILPDNSLHSCLLLLSSNDLDLNRLGLQRLNLLISGRTILDSYGSEEIASYVLVFGGPMGSMEELLRFCFVTMICNAPHTHSDNAMDNLAVKQSLSDEEAALEDWIVEYDPSKGAAASSGHFDDESSNELTNASTHSYASCDSERVMPQLWGKAGGVLHNHALKILANALRKVYALDPKALSGIPLHCSLWKSIVSSLVGNIEQRHSAKATVYSMKILRFLYFVQPDTILPLLKYSLFAVLVDLKDYGEIHGLPMISKEASKLLKHARGK